MQDQDRDTPFDPPEPPLTYAELWHGADVLIRKGGEDEASSRWVFLSALLMLSLCLEAYLNHAGPLLFGSTWSEGPQALVHKNVRARLALICTACGVEWSARRKYWTVASTLIDLRTSLVLARQTRLNAAADTRTQEQSGVVDPSWSPYCNRAVVLDYRAELRSLLASIHGRLPAQGRGNLFTLSS